MPNASRLLFAAVAAVTVLSAAPYGVGLARGTPQPQRQCFDASAVNGFTAVDETHVNLQVGAGRVYQLTLLAPCRNIDWNWRLAVRARGGGLICSGLDAEIIVPDRFFPSRCQVSDVRRIDPLGSPPRPPRPRP